MPVTLNDLESAFLASDPGRDARSWIHAETSQVRFSFEYHVDSGPPPEDEPGWHLLPDARGLDLKQSLVRDFVASECPELDDDVRQCFSRRGGWRAFKDLLRHRGLLDRWHHVEHLATRRALLAWAAGQGLSVVDLPPEHGHAGPDR